MRLALFGFIPGRHFPAQFVCFNGAAYACCNVPHLLFASIELVRMLLALEMLVKNLPVGDRNCHNIPCRIIICSINKCGNLVFIKNILHGIGRLLF